MSWALENQNDLIEEVDEKGKDLAHSVRESSFPFRFVSNLPKDDFGRVISYTRSANEKPPPGFKRRVECPLCHMWFDCFNLVFYYHCEGKHILNLSKQSSLIERLG